MMKRLALLLSILLIAGAVDAPRAQEFSQPPSISPRKFALMAWGHSPSDPDQLYWMRQAGLNISGFCSPKDLDKVNAAGLSCFVTDPLANQYDWAALPNERILQQNIADLVLKVANHPAASGFFLDDEPNTTIMPGLGRVAWALRQAMPQAWPYVNLLPNYTPLTQLRAKNYENYLQKFIKEVHPSVVSYDNYSLFNGTMLDRFYTNLGIIRRVSLKAGIPF